MSVYMWKPSGGKRGAAASGTGEGENEEWAAPGRTSFPLSTREIELLVPGMTFKSATCQKTSWRA